jgi:hypothetical protein
MDCKKAKNNITLYLYGELDEEDRASLQQHLQECRSCAEELDYTKKVFKLLDEYQPAPAHEPNWESSWQRIQSGIARTPAKDKARLFPRWRWVYAGSAIVAVLIIGIIIGKYWLAPSPQPIQTKLPTTILPAALPPTLSSHLEDLKPLLLEYAHYTPGEQGTKTMIVDEKIVRGLLLQNLLLKRRLAEKDPAAAELLDDLDLVLKEIANQPSQDRQAPSQIKDLINKRGILFKMEILKTL